MGMAPRCGVSEVGGIRAEHDDREAGVDGGGQCGKRLAGSRCDEQLIY